MILALTSKTLSPGQIYDQASNILEQRLSQVDGVGNVQLNGASLPAVRIELNPRALFKYGIGLEDVRAAVSAANANSPKGGIEQGAQPPLCPWPNCETEYQHRSVGGDCVGGAGAAIGSGGDA